MDFSFIGELCLLQVSEALSKMKELEEQLEEARKAVPDMKEENAHLSRERDQLQVELERQRVLQRDMQDHLV